MAGRVGTGYVDVFAKLNQAQLGSEVKSKLGAAGSQGGASFAKAFQGKIKGAFSSLSNLGIGGGGLGALFGAATAGAVIAGIKKVTDETVKYAGEVRKLQRLTGDTAEDASRFAAVMKGLGIETDAAQRPFLFLAQNLAKGGKDMKTYFSTAEIASLRTHTLSQDVDLLSERYRSLKDPIAQNDFLVSTFGKRGATQMRSLLASTNEERDALGKMAQVQGLIFTEQQQKDIRQYGIAMRELGQTFKGLEVQIGKVAIPLASTFAQNLNQKILDIEDSAHRVSGLFDKLPDSVKKGFSSFVKGVGRQLPFIQYFIPADEKAKELNATLQELVQSAAEDEEAFKELGKTAKSAFDLMDKSAADFDKRLGELSPSLGEPFKDVDFGIKNRFDKDADAIESARERVEDAQERLSDSWKKFSSGSGFDKGKWQPTEGIFTLDQIRKSQEQFAKSELEREADFMSDHAGDLGDAARDYKDASEDLRKAKEELSKTEKGTLVEGFSTILGENTADLNLFADSLEKLKTRFAKLGGSGVDEFEESFLAGLAELGPGAAGMIANVVDLSDKELSALKDKFAAQVQAAKRAVDIEFDKYPANFAEKMAKARSAAVAEGDQLIEKFNNLEGNLTLQDAMSDEITGTARVMESILEPVLTEQQLNLLHTAERAEEAGDKIDALQKFINSLKSKTVEVKVLADATAFWDFAEKLSNQTGLPITGQIAIQHQGGLILHKGGHSARGLRSDEVPAILQRGEFVINRDSARAIGLEKLQLLNRMHSGGSPGYKNTQAVATSGTTTIVVPVNLDGREIARVTAPYNSRAADHRRRARV
jgi:hypothetical protein